MTALVHPAPGYSYAVVPQGTYEQDVERLNDSLSFQEEQRRVETTSPMTLYAESNISILGQSFIHLSTILPLSSILPLVTWTFLWSLMHPSEQLANGLGPCPPVFSVLRLRRRYPADLYWMWLSWKYTGCIHSSETHTANYSLFPFISPLRNHFVKVDADQV